MNHCHVVPDVHSGRVIHPALTDPIHLETRRVAGGLLDEYLLAEISSGDTSWIPGNESILGGSRHNIIAFPADERDALGVHVDVC